MENALAGTDWEIMKVTARNLCDFLSTARCDRIHDVWKNAQIEHFTQGFSDLVRLSVLAEHGGVYVDSTVILL